MSNKVALRKVMRNGMFYFQGKLYEIESPKFAGECVVVHYDSHSGEVQKIEAEDIGESRFLLRRISNE